ncbi:MAG TPA: LysE family transporter [Candidatus Limnocylindria bacterium]|nr:LysE family transporter [Candidatus Limnocylindria bacterium]
MLGVFLIGAAAGYAIAIPVGPIAVLIVRTGLRRGFRVAAAAGAGTATVDLIYALVAVLVGGAVTSLFAAVLLPMRLAAAAALAYLGLRGLLRLRHTDPSLDAGDGRSAARTYLLFIGLTFLNPATVAYFVTLAVGLPEIAHDAGARLAFAVGASLSSLSWQTLLAAIGAALHTRLGPRIELGSALLSSTILVTFALKIAADALAR